MHYAYIIIYTIPSYIHNILVTVAFHFILVMKRILYVFFSIAAVLKDYNYCKVLANQLPLYYTYTFRQRSAGFRRRDRRIVYVKSVLFSLGKFTENNEIICPEFTMHTYI